MYHYEKVLKASDKSDIVWFVSSVCSLRRHWLEHTCKNNCLLYWCFCSETFVWAIFSVIVKSIRSSTCWQNEAFTSEFKFRTNPPRLGYFNPVLNNLAQVDLFCGTMAAELNNTVWCMYQESHAFSKEKYKGLIQSKILLRV